MSDCFHADSGVAIHVLPGCVCPGPLVEDPTTGEAIAKAPNHVNVSDSNGVVTSISLDQARNAGYIS